MPPKYVANGGYISVVKMILYTRTSLKLKYLNPFQNPRHIYIKKTNETPATANNFGSPLRVHINKVPK